MKQASSHINRKVPQIYLYLYKRLVNLYKNKKIEIDVSDIISSNRLIIHQIPTKEDYHIVYELVHYGLLKKINSRKYELILKDYDKIVEPIETFAFWDKD